ncbi:MAG: restriction endonuclease subunit S, partial [bacterium]
SEQLDPWWIALNIRHDAESHRLEKYFTGTTIKHLTGRSLAKYEFALPPLKEQKEIVKRVEALFKIADQVEAHYRKAKAQVDKLTQTILAKAFRAKLVPQDPNDEPAERLLERIKASKQEREFSGKKRKSRNG